MPDALALAPIELLGVPVQLRSNDTDVAERLERCYQRSVTEHAAGAAVLEAKLARRGDAWRIDVTGRARCTAEDPVHAVRSFNHELVHGVMLRAPQLYYVHAGVVTSGGAALVMPGLSRAGKSTLVLALIEQGAQLLSDELLAFDPASALACAFPRAIKIRDACAGYFPSLSPHFSGSGEGRFLSFDGLPGDVISSPAPVASIVVPTWTGSGREDLEPISAGRALLDLAASSLNFGTHRVRSLDCLAAMVDEARAWRLGWSDPHAAASKILTALGACA